MLGLFPNTSKELILIKACKDEVRDARAFKEEELHVGVSSTETKQSKKQKKHRILYLSVPERAPGIESRFQLPAKYEFGRSKPVLPGHNNTQR